MNYEQTYYQTRPSKARDFRKIARERLSGFWWTAILVTLIAALLGGIVAGGASIEYNFGNAGAQEDYVPEPDEETIGEEEPLTPEEQEAFEEAFINSNFEPMKDLISKEIPMLGFILSIIGIIFVAGFVFAIAFNLFISSPVKVGYQRFCLEVLDGNKSEIRVGTLFRFFKEGYGKTIGLNFVHGLIMDLTLIPMFVCMTIGGVSFVSSLSAMFSNFDAVGFDTAIMGGLLAFIGLTFLGIVISLCISIPVSYTYSMAHMIMADYPGVGAIEALRLSRQLMRGNKFRLFCLDISFIGWILLGACACGLGGYVVTPYQYVARAAFYHEISGRKTPEDVEFPSINPQDYIIE